MIDALVIQMQWKLDFDEIQFFDRQNAIIFLDKYHDYATVMAHKILLWSVCCDLD